MNEIWETEAEISNRVCTLRKLTEILSIIKCALIEQSDLLKELRRGSQIKPFNGPGCQGPLG